MHNFAWQRNGKLVCGSNQLVRLPLRLVQSILHCLAGWQSTSCCCLNSNGRLNMLRLGDVIGFLTPWPQWAAPPAGILALLDAVLS